MKSINEILLLLCLPYLLFAQSNNEFISFRTDNSNIPSNKIYGIAVDSNNVRWVATDKGLASFDGSVWKVFNTSNDLLSNNVIAVAVDKSNSIWIIDSVLSKYDGFNWTHYTRDKYTNASIYSRTLAIDENNVKWMTTVNSYGGRDVCSFNDTVFTIYDWGNTTYELRSVWNIKTFKNEKWIADYATLWKYDDKKLTRIGYDSLTNSIKSGIIDAFNISKNGKVLLSFHRTFGIIDAMIDSCYIYEIVNSYKYYFLKDLPNDFSFGVAYENEDTKWFGLGSTLYKYREGLWSSFKYGFDLSRLGIITVDKLGNKWLASQYDWYNNGVSVFKEGGVILTSIREDLNYLPLDYRLEQNYPNPFNPSTIITFEIPKSSFVTLDVYDILGKKISTLVLEEKSAGKYNAQFNANRLSSGIYFYTLRTNDFIQTKKMILIK